jgi:Protein of unknwon function (DUF3310)
MFNIAEDANNFDNKPISFIKICTKCNISKDISEYYKSINSRDGFESLCKSCKSDYYKNKKENKKLLSFKDIPPHKKWWVAENKLKNIAHSKVRYAITKGELIRQPCERCGTTVEVVAHHEDYNKPLEVMWLCKFHHKERHREIDVMGKENDKKQPDMVNSPPHYTHGGIETIAYIRAKLSPEEYIGYLRGNIEKYNSRIGLKDDAAQDSGKILWYATELNRFLTER